MGPRYQGVEDWVVASVAGDGDDLGLAGCSSLEVLDAVGFGWVVVAEFGGANDDFQVGGLVEALGFTGLTRVMTPFNVTLTSAPVTAPVVGS